MSKPPNEGLTSQTDEDVGHAAICPKMGLSDRQYCLPARPAENRVISKYPREWLDLF